MARGNQISNAVGTGPKAQSGDLCEDPCDLHAPAVVFLCRH